MSWYRTGTIALTNGSTVVVGTGTDFITGVAVGEGLLAPDGKIYEVSSIQSAVGLTLGSGYLGSNASGQTYAIIPSQSYIRDLASQAAALVNGYQSVKDNAGTGKFGDGTAALPGISFVSDPNTGIRRSASDEVSLVAGGADKARVNSTGLVALVMRLRNVADTFSGLLTNTITAARTWTMPDKDGTVAMTSDVHDATSKTTPADADELGLIDSAASNVLKKLTWANLKATLATWLGSGAIAGAFTTLSATGNTTLGDSSTDTLNVGNGGLIKDSAGNVGIGVTPSAWGGTLRALEVTGASNTGFVGGYIGATPMSLVTKNAYFNGSDWIYSATGYTASIYRQSDGENRWLTAPSGIAGDPIAFTPAMTLDAGGSLLVGTTTLGAWSLGGVAIRPQSGASEILLGHGVGTGSSVPYVEFGYNSAGIGSITQLGTTAVSYNTTSDHRLKTNVRDANAARFMDIQFRDFEWVDGRHDCGVIAHELQEVYPDLVLGEKDAVEVRTVEITPAVPAVLDEEGKEVTPAVQAVTEEQTFPVYQQVNYIGLIGRMGTRVQALQRTVDAQAELIEAMEARLSTLETAGGSQ